MLVVSSFVTCFDNLFSSFATRLLLSLCGILILVCCFYSSLLIAALNIIALRSPVSDSPTALLFMLLPTVLPLSVLFSPGIQSNKEFSAVNNFS